MTWEVSTLPADGLARLLVADLPMLAEALEAGDIVAVTGVGEPPDGPGHVSFAGYPVLISVSCR